MQPACAVRSTLVERCPAIAFKEVVCLGKGYTDESSYQHPQQMRRRPLRLTFTTPVHLDFPQKECWLVDGGGGGGRGEQAHCSQDSKYHRLWQLHPIDDPRLEAS